MKEPIVVLHRPTPVPAYYILIDALTGAQCVVPASTTWGEARAIMGTKWMEVSK